MKSGKPSVQKISAKVEPLRQLSNNLYENSANFPAADCNAKRIVASVKMLRINPAGDKD